MCYATWAFALRSMMWAREPSNLDRIGILEPDILKVDLDSLKGEEETLAYYGVIHSLSLLARKIGAALLFEGLETREEVKFAWQNGARYYQGYYLSEPRGTFVDHALMKERFSRMVRQFIEEKKTVYHKECKKEEAIQQRVKEIFSAEAPAENLDQWLLTIGDRLNDICFRIYICNENGDQLTANAVCREGRWSLDPASRNKNWSWRPYFLQNSVKMGVDGQGILSDYYQDIEFKALIHTFSYPLDNKTFVFFDLMPDMDV